MPSSIALNCDCMEYMKTLPDNAFDLAVVDPPYGINRFKHGETSRLRKYGTFATANDAVPTREYFQELRRVSRIDLQEERFERHTAQGNLFLQNPIESEEPNA